MAVVCVFVWLSRVVDVKYTAWNLDISIPEVALISGHKDGKMLFRYTHLKAGNLTTKLG